MSALAPIPASSVGDAWADALAEAQRTWGPFALPLERFVARADALIARRLARAGVESTATARAETIRRTARADLALAVACDERLPGAWEALHLRLFPRLRGLARKRGMTDTDAETLASDVLSELALPPGGTSGARTLLGTFDGTGSLFGWSAVILVRRLSRLGRRAPQSLLEASDQAAPGPAAERADPVEILGDAETARRFDRALRVAWEQLSWRERLALTLRYLDGKSQVEIARLLSLSAPRVSRIVTGAVEKLRAGLVGAAGGEQAGRRLLAVLADAVRKRMAPTGASAPLPDHPGPQPGARKP